ncbi:pseudouridylate synthase RPUSD2-like [Uloborus diversus]|uniref:pseudouridylate synthase RPUSD2-like n=1 Tax=Uloborus diversus TaxID=327109 RepID=UPI00240987B0|nr:pseudouridylate synthase RPUSD2-like [Uloborus diversus]
MILRNFTSLSNQAICSVFVKQAHKVTFNVLRNWVLKVNLHNAPLDCLPKTQNYSHYFIEDGLRYVYPYQYEFSNFCKQRWMGRRLIDIYSEEFPLYPVEEYLRRISTGMVKINGKSMGADYVLKSNDHISSIIHRHELAVLAMPIRILFEDDEFLVVNKPPSIPVHPCGLFNRNTVTNILSYERKYRDLFLIHRIDRLTSGVLIMAKTKDMSRKLHEQINTRNVKKVYLCRVEGNFPDKQITCSVPIKKYRRKINVSLVHPHGKKSVTEFQKISYNGKSSVVLCKPFTGRTHQIRVHLQYLGHPILNDPLYNNEAFGATKGKHGIINKTIDELLSDLHKVIVCDLWDNNIVSGPNEIDKFLINKTDSHLDYELESAYAKNLSAFTFDKHCYFCSNNIECKQTHFGMFLHAWKYQGEDWEFKTDIPTWASKNFSAV